ncbi:MAG TPA: hypothetical protein VFZ58_00235 [Candidatus Saccharimonadales bacterium]
MDLSVHIVGQDSSSEAIAARLKGLGINVDQLHGDYSVLYNTYQNVFESFHKITTADVVLIGSQVTPDNVLEVLYAVLKNKPIVTNGTASCADGVDNFSKEIINKSLAHFYAKDITKIDEAQLRHFLTETASQAVNYQLQSYQAALIRARVRAFFRVAVSPTVMA